jgi:hypothetical protein
VGLAYHQGARRRAVCLLGFAAGQPTPRPAGPGPLPAHDGYKARSATWKTTSSLQRTLIDAAAAILHAAQSSGNEEPVPLTRTDTQTEHPSPAEPGPAEVASVRA